MFNCFDYKETTVVVGNDTDLSDILCWYWLETLPSCLLSRLLRLCLFIWLFVNFMP